MTKLKFERAVQQMFDGWKAYAVAHREMYEAPVGEDGVMGEEWQAIGKALRGLCNGELGRLDAGTLHSSIRETMEQNGVTVSK